MLDLVAFELKKVVSRRTTLVTCSVLFVLICGIMTLNVLQTKTESNTGEVLSGLDAISYNREAANAHAGELSTERIVADLTAYRDLALSKMDAQELSTMSDAAAYSLMKQVFTLEEQAMLADGYYSYLLSPWRVAGQEPYQTAAQLTDEQMGQFYETVAQGFQETLDDGMGGSWTYTDEERSYWTAMQQRVEEPLAYGYAGGWEDILNCVAFLTFAMLGVCVALAPMFAAEYQERTDAVLLASRFGRSRLVAAKVIAAFVFATAYFALHAAVICGVALIAFGAEGANLPVQVMSTSIPYDLTMAQAAGVSVGIAYAMMLGFAGLTLALSSRTKSTLAVFAAAAALILVTGIIPTAGNGVLMHIMYLAPLNALVPQPLLADCMSYPLGTAVVDLQTMLLVLYGVVMLIGAIVAVISFRRHQVA